VLTFRKKREMLSEVGRPGGQQWDLVEWTGD